MWTMIPSLADIVADLAPAFTKPSFTASCRFLLGWVMCLGKHPLFRVAENTQPQQPPDHSGPHGFDTSYNFFERSAWTPKALAYRVGVLLLTRLNLSGRITLLVDDTLAHKRGKCVWGMGWFRDAVCVCRTKSAAPCRTKNAAPGSGYQTPCPADNGVTVTSWQSSCWPHDACAAAALRRRRASLSR
jgi:hypothetical protein